jgi:hypothetical protein
MFKTNASSIQSASNRHVGESRLLLSCVVAMATGCIDYTLTEMKSADTGTEMDPWVCENLPYEVNGTADTCHIWNASYRTGMSDDAGRGAERAITAVTLAGHQYDPSPDDVRVGRQPKAGPTSAWTDTMTTDGAGYGNGTWTADSPGEINDINNVAPDEEWRSIVEISDSGAPEVCPDYEDIDVCYDLVFTTAMRRPPADSDCTAGSGVFALFPVAFQDGDHDDDVSVVFQAVQVSGTGVLTDAAWIRDITALETHGATLRVAKVNQPFRFEAYDDTLVNASTVSYSVSSEGSSFGSGLISGAAPFMVEEVDGSEDSDFAVEMEWECGSVSQWAGAQRGYVLNSESFDNCTWDIPQAFVLRPRLVEGEPVMMRIMPYGQLNTWVITPVVEVGNTFQWEYSFLDFHVAGTIDDVGEEQMDITLDDLSFDGTDLCDPGTYSLPVAE